MTDPAFLARVAALLVTRARTAEGPDPGPDGRRVLAALTALAGRDSADTLTARIAADAEFAGALRAAVLKAYAVPALARGLPDPAPPGGRTAGCGS